VRNLTTGITGFVGRRGGGAETSERLAGWRPEFPLAQTLTDLLDDWRRRLASRPA
jgi:hypothetical protein